MDCFGLQGYLEVQILYAHQVSRFIGDTVSVK